MYGVYHRVYLRVYLRRDLPTKRLSASLRK